MAGQPTTVQVQEWADEVAAVGERIGRHFARSEPRRRAIGYIRGLPGDAERKNGWQLPSTSATTGATGRPTRTARPRRRPPKDRPAG